MPVLAARTRRQLRASVLYNCGAIIEITASATGTTTTVVTNQLALGASDDYRGWRIWPTSGANNANLLRTVTASSVAASVTTLTIAPALTDATAANDTFQLIGKSGLELHPEIVNEYINQAIIEVTGLAFVPVESLALHGDGRQTRFDVPSTLTAISGVYTRRSVESTVIHDAATEWDEAAAPANVTRVVDTEDYKVGGASNKFTIAGGFTTGVVSSKAITSLDLSGYDYVEFWVKSTTATAAGDFTLLLDDTALAVSALETLSIPALAADTWTFVRVALGNPELDTAIISVALNAAVNIAANTVWISDVRGVLDSTASWVLMDRNNWRAEENTRDLVFRHAPPSRLLKLTGGNTPSLLTADATANTIDDDFVIARATERTLLSQGGGPSTDPDALRSLASYWGKRADQAKAALPWTPGMRVVS